jgi:peroxin-12
MLVIERHFLKTYGGGFTENFYGLKREKAIHAEIPRAQIGAPKIVRETLALTEVDIWKNLAIMVGLPYLKRKLDESYDINAPRALLGISYTQLPPNPTIKQRLLHYYRWFLRNIYPSVNAAYYFSLIAFNLAYLFDNSKYHSPFLWLIGTRLRRLTQADHEAIALLNDPPPTNPAAVGRPGPTSLFNPRTLIPRLLSGLKFLLPTSIFALKFLEWWHASDFARQLSRKATEGLLLPPPIISGLFSLPRREAQPQHQPDSADVPPNPPVAASSLLPIFVVPLPPPAQSSLCPICERDVQTPTACQTGFVFCYACIHRWVLGEHERQQAFMSGAGREGRWEAGKGRCAVTGRRVLGGTEGLRRVMV